jgi:hypothetical protein
VKSNIDKKAWSEVSTLDYITSKVAFNLAKDKHVSYQICLTGLNGVGHFMKGDTCIQSFDRLQMLDTVNEVIKLEGVVGTKNEGTYDSKNLNLAQLRLKKHFETKSCHYITYLVDTKALKFDVKAKLLRQADLKDYASVVKGQL